MASAQWPPQGSGSGSGTVTSVGLADSTGLFLISGSPVTTTGTLTLTSPNDPLSASQALFTDASGFIISNAITGTGNVVMSASPTLTGTAVLASATVSGSLKKGNYHIEPNEFDNGNATGTVTLDWSADSAQRIEFTGNTTVTMTNPQKGGPYLLKCVNNGTAYTITWPSSVRWAAGVSPPFTGTLNQVDILSFYYDGTSYFGTYVLNF